MSRPVHIIRPTRLEISVPEDLRAKLDLMLFSPLEGRVPAGEYSRFINRLIKDYFSKETPHGSEP